MVETLSVADAKRRFSELIDRVLDGERFLVLRRGRPAVALVPPEEADDEQRPKPLGFLPFIGALAEWDAEIEEMVNEIYAARRRAKDRPAPDFGD